MSFLRKNGYKNVTCIDLFCKNSMYSNIKFINCSITDLDDDEKFDIITMNSSFEHMNNPHEVLNKVNQLLNNNGLCLIKIPIDGNEAWKRYKENWFQIDAPRHYFLYLPKAMRIMCEKHGLTVENILYYSGNKQFFISKMYKDSDMNFKEAIAAFNALPKREKVKYEKEAEFADKQKKGDVAWFYIKHKTQ